MKVNELKARSAMCNHTLQDIIDELKKRGYSVSTSSMSAYNKLQRYNEEICTIALEIVKQWEYEKDNKH